MSSVRPNSNPNENLEKKSILEEKKFQEDMFSKLRPIIHTDFVRVSKNIPKWVEWDKKNQEKYKPQDYARRMDYFKKLLTQSQYAINILNSPPNPSNLQDFILLWKEARRIMAFYASSGMMQEAKTSPAQTSSTISEAKIDSLKNPEILTLENGINVRILSEVRSHAYSDFKETKSKIQQWKKLDLEGKIKDYLTKLDIQIGCALKKLDLNSMSEEDAGKIIILWGYTANREKEEYLSEDEELYEDPQGDTALSCAVSEKNFDNVKQLLESQADINNLNLC